MSAPALLAVLALPRLAPQPNSGTELPRVPDCPGQFPKLYHTSPWLPPPPPAVCLGCKAQQFLHQCLFTWRQPATQKWEDRVREVKCLVKNPWLVGGILCVVPTGSFDLVSVIFPLDQQTPTFLPHKQMGTLWILRHNTEQSTTRYQLPHMPLQAAVPAKPVERNSPVYGSVHTARRPALQVVICMGQHNLPSEVLPI